MQVGNTWKYKGKSFSGTIYGGYNDSILRVIRVYSLIQTGDTNSYGISIWDSLFFRRNTSIPNDTTWLTDTVQISYDRQIEVQGVLIDAAFTSFSSHFVPDSIIKGTVSFGGQNPWVCDSIWPKVPLRSSFNGTYAQNIGLISNDIRSDFGGQVRSNGFRLIEFNGVPLGDYTITGILGKSVKSRRLIVFPLSGFGAILGTNRNVLGRIPIGVKSK